MLEAFWVQDTIFTVCVPCHTEIGLPTGSQFLSVDSDEEREEWVESIKRCSVSACITIETFMFGFADVSCIALGQLSFTSY